MYRENPKTKGSGIQAAIPQAGRCPVGCADCFFQSGRSYLEPLDENLPNLPEPRPDRIVRVNDGNDSNVQRELVMEATKKYPLRFYNTSFPQALGAYPGPVVLTLNPGKYTDSAFHTVEPTPNLMYVRFRTNTWNLKGAADAIDYYTAREVPVVLTFMAYHSVESIPTGWRCDYIERKRTQNSYWAITTDAWRRVMTRWQDNPWVHSCGKIEGERGVTKCRHCGNCHREFFVTMERISRQEETCVD